MLDTYTVTFTGHRCIDNILQVEMRLEKIIRELIQDHEYVELLVGRDGEFDQIESSTVIRMKKRSGNNNCALVWVMPYLNAEYENNTESFDNYYDEIEICEESSCAHFKGAIQIRNRHMVDRASLLICFVDHESGGAYQTLKYARKQRKSIINLAEENE
jgi:hypothetical protein